MEASKPVQICFGKVMGVSPISIMVEQKLSLGQAQLILSRNVSDFTTEVSVGWTTTDGHPIQGRKKITVHNGLVVGDEVILYRMQGGQKFIVIDRIKK